MDGINHPDTWNRQKPPPGYIPGVGRGAMGFTTRSDIGPANAPAAPTVPGIGRGAGGMPGAAAGGPTAAGGASGSGGAEGERDYSESNYDTFAGYQEVLFSDTPYEKDDQEADNIWQAVDERMDSRRKRQRYEFVGHSGVALIIARAYREENERQAMKQMRIERPRIGDQFAELRAKLADVTTDEWASIPDIGDYSIKNKHRMQQRFTPVSDSLIDMRRSDNKTVSALDPRALAGGLETPMGGVTDLRGLSEARGTMLEMRLDRMGDNVGGQTVVDPKGYLTGLNSISVDNSTDVGDYKKAVELLNGMTTANPKHAPGWLALARVHKKAHNMKAARLVLKKACEMCPDSEDVWMEAAGLAAPEAAKLLLATAVQQLPQSVKLWIAAAELEHAIDAKKNVLRKAVQTIPNSVRLWKAAVELEEEEDARVLLGQAVKCVPQSVDMWLALARLEPYERARLVLNEARTNCPTEAGIWIAAAKLEEAQGRAEIVEKVIKKGVVTLAQNGVTIDREEWLKLAEEAEQSEAPLTAAAIVAATVDIGVEKEDGRRTWLADAEALTKRRSYKTARAVYAHMLRQFPTKASIWRAAAELEKLQGDKAAMDAVLKAAVAACPKAEVLWLIAAKEKYLSGATDEARGILKEAFLANPDSEQIWLAAVKVEWESGENERARGLLAEARRRCSTERVWMKSALFERENGDRTAEERLILEALQYFKEAPKLWMMAGQLYEALGNVEQAATMYQDGLKHCGNSIPLWRLAARFHEKHTSVTKARTLLELGRLRNPGVPELWIESIRLERRAGQLPIASTMMAKARQECPKSGMLLAEDIATSPKHMKRTKLRDALQVCESDPLVTIQAAKMFVTDRRHDIARKWFLRAVTLNPDLGDAWAEYYKYELERGTDEQQKEVLRKFEEADPHHGELWCEIAKNAANRTKKPAEILGLAVAQLMANDRAAAAAGGGDEAADAVTA